MSTVVLFTLRVYCLNRMSNELNLERREEQHDTDLCQKGFSGSRIALVKRLQLRTQANWKLLDHPPLAPRRNDLAWSATI